MTESRVLALEVKIAFLENSLSELSEEYYAQQKELESLKLAVKHLGQRLDESGSSEPNTGYSLEEKPPHY